MGSCTIDVMAPSSKLAAASVFAILASTASLSAQGTTIRERVRNLLEHTAQLQQANSLKESRLDAATEAVRAEHMGTGQLQGNDHLVAKATDIQYAFDGDEAPKIHSEYLGRVAGARNSWAGGRDSGAAKRAKAEKTMAQDAEADLELWKTCRDATEDLRSSVDNSNLEAKAREKVGRRITQLERRLSSFKDELKDLHDAETAVIAAEGAIALQEGRAAGVRHDWNGWLEIATRWDSDEGPWARYGTEERAGQGWEHAAKVYADERTADANQQRRQLQLAQQNLTTSRERGRSLAREVRDQLTVINDILDLIEGR